MKEVKQAYKDDPTYKERMIASRRKKNKPRPPISELTRERLRLAQKQRPPITEETRQKMRAIARARPRERIKALTNASVKARQRKTRCPQ